MAAVSAEPETRASSVASLPSSSEIAASDELNTTPGKSRAASTSDSYSRTIRSRAKAVTTFTPSARAGCRMYEITVSSASKGTLFLSFQRSIGSASCGVRGNSSKCCTKTRITGSGSSNATSSSLARKRLSTPAMALFSAAGLTTLASIAEGTSAPGGRASTAKPSSELPCVQRAAATRSCAISMARCGCGVGSSHREMRPQSPRSEALWRSVATLLNESHLVDFLQGCNPVTDFGQAAFAQCGHSFFASHALDFRRRPAVHDHFADAVGQVQQCANRSAPVKSRAGAFQTAGALDQRDIAPHQGIESRFRQLFRGMFLRPLAIRADYADETLRHDAVERGNKVVRLDAHVDEAPDDVGYVVGVHGSEHQMPGERGLNGDLRGFLVADFADHDFVGIVAQDGAQSAREGQSFFLIHRNLRNAAKLVLNGIFDGDNFVFVGLDFVDRRIQRGGLAGARRPGHQHHAVRFANVAAKAPRLFRRKTDDVQSEALKFLGKRFFVQHAQHGIFAVTRGHDGNAQVDKAALVLHAEAPVLRDAALGNVQVAEHLDARNHRGMPFLGDGLHGVLQHAVDAVLHRYFRVARLDVNVAGAPLERGEDDLFHQADDRTDGAIAREAIAGNRLFALFFFFRHLQGERFGGLFQNALGLLRALEQVADLPRGGHLDR